MEQLTESQYLEQLQAILKVMYSIFSSSLSTGIDLSKFIAKIISLNLLGALYNIGKMLKFSVSLFVDLVKTLVSSGNFLKTLLKVSKDITLGSVKLLFEGNRYVLLLLATVFSYLYDNLKYHGNIFYELAKNSLNDSIADELKSSSKSSAIGKLLNDEAKVLLQIVFAAIGSILHVLAAITLCILYVIKVLAVLLVKSKTILQYLGTGITFDTGDSDNNFQSLGSNSTSPKYLGKF